MASYTSLMKQGSVIPFGDMVACMTIFNAGLHAYFHGYKAGVEYVMPWATRPPAKEEHTAKH